MRERLNFILHYNNYKKNVYPYDTLLLFSDLIKIHVYCKTNDFNRYYCTACFETRDDLKDIQKIQRNSIITLELAAIYDDKYWCYRCKRNLFEIVDVNF